MKWIGWPKQDDLWRSDRAGQMHGRGINRDEQARVFEQCREREKIELPGKIEHSRAQFFPNSGNMRAFEFVTTSRQNRKETKFVSGKFHYFCPAFRFPKLFRSRRARMKNGEWLIANSIADNGEGALLRRRRKIKHWIVRSRGNSERLQKCETVIRRVHLFHRAINELVVKTGAEFRFDFQSVGNNSSRRGGQKGQPGGAIAAGEVDHAIETGATDFHPGGKIAQSTFR